MKALILGISVSIFASFHTQAQDNIELKRLATTGGSIVVKNGASFADTCFYSIMAAGEMAQSGMFSAGVYSGNFGYIHPDEDTLFVICGSVDVLQVNLLNNEIAVYPNPNDGSFTTKLSILENEFGQIKIVDVLGREVRNNKVSPEKGSNLYNFSGFSPGLYFLWYQPEAQCHSSLVKIVVN